MGLSRGAVDGVAANLLRREKFPQPGVGKASRGQKLARYTCSGSPRCMDEDTVWGEQPKKQTTTTVQTELCKMERYIEKKKSRKKATGEMTSHWLRIASN